MFLKQGFDDQKFRVKKVRELYKLKSEKFSEDIKIELSNENKSFLKLSTEEIVLNYNFTMKKLLNKHCPLIKKIQIYAYSIKVVQLYTSKIKTRKKKV